MSDWNRTTQEITPGNGRSDLIAAIVQHIESYHLGAVLQDALMRIETSSEKKKKGLFGGKGDKVVVCHAIVTSNWLIWAVAGDKSGVATLSVPLKNATITDYALSPNYLLLPDSGLDVSGPLTCRVGVHGDPSVSAFIGLGPEPAAQKFKTVVQKARQST